MLNSEEEKLFPKGTRQLQKKFLKMIFVYVEKRVIIRKKDDKKKLEKQLLQLNQYEEKRHQKKLKKI